MLHAGIALSNLAAWGHSKADGTIFSSGQSERYLRCFASTQRLRIYQFRGSQDYIFAEKGKKKGAGRTGIERKKARNNYPSKESSGASKELPLQNVGSAHATRSNERRAKRRFVPKDSRGIPRRHSLNPPSHRYSRRNFPTLGATLFKKKERTR